MTEERPPYSGPEGQSFVSASVRSGQQVRGRRVEGKSAANLVTNGDFEGAVTTGWTATSGSLSTSGALAASGSRSLTITSAGSAIGAYADDIPVDAGKPYRVRVALARNATIAYDAQLLVGFRLYNSSGTYLRTDYTVLTLAASNTFEYVEHIYVAESDVASIRPLVGAVATVAAGGILYVDDVEATPATGGTFDGIEVGDVSKRGLAVGASALHGFDQEGPAPVGINAGFGWSAGAPVLGPGGIPLLQLIDRGNTLAGTTPPEAVDSHSPYFLQAGYEILNLAGAAGAYVTFPTAFPNGLLGGFITPVLHIAIDAQRSRLSHWVGTSSDRTQLHVLAHDPGDSDHYDLTSYTTGGGHDHTISNDGSHDHTGNTGSSSGHIHSISADGTHDHGGLTGSNGTHGGHFSSVSHEESVYHVAAGFYSGLVGYLWMAIGW